MTPTQNVGGPTNDAERLAAIEARVKRQADLQAESIALFEVMLRDGEQDDAWVQHYWDVHEEIGDIRADAVEDRDYLLAQLREAREQLARYETQDGQPY